MARNEGKVCDAVVRVLEFRERQRRTDVVRPDSAGRASQVDFRVRLGAQVYAIEHTQVEAYENQVRSDRHFTELVGPVKAELSGTLPGDAVYELHFPADTGLDKHSSELCRAQATLVQWVRLKADELHARDTDFSPDEPSFGPYHQSVSQKPPGFPYKVTLHRTRPSRFAHGGPGSLDVTRIVPEGLEASRADRLRRAIGAKCPKLHRCKADGARTVLVLESSDLALTNPVLVCGPVIRELSQRDDVPDEVYFVQTFSTDWHVFSLTVEGVYPPTGFYGIPKFPEVDLLDLCDVASAGCG